MDGCDQHGRGRRPLQGPAATVGGLYLRQLGLPDARTHSGAGDGQFLPFFSLSAVLLTALVPLAVTWLSAQDPKASEQGFARRDRLRSRDRGVVLPCLGI